MATKAPTSLLEALSITNPSLANDLVRSPKEKKENKASFELNNKEIYEEVKSQLPHWTNEKEEKIFVSKIFNDHGFSKRPSKEIYDKVPNGKNLLEICAEKGLPYGHDKDLINLITSQIIQHNEKELYFPAKAEMLREMGKVPHSDTVKRLVESLFRVRFTTFIFHDNVNKKDPFTFQVIKSVNFVGQGVTINVSDEYFDHITKKKTKYDPATKKKSESFANLRPLDVRMVKELMGNRTALDIFNFVSFRALGKSAKINVVEFMDQIGSGVQSAKQFVKNFTGKVANKIGSAFKKVYNIDLPKGLFKILPSGRGHKKSFTLEIKGGSQLIPPLIT